MFLRKNLPAAVVTVETENLSVHLLSFAPSCPGGGAVVRRFARFSLEGILTHFGSKTFELMSNGEICPIKIKVPPLKPKATLLLLLLLFLLLLCFKQSLD